MRHLRWWTVPIYVVFGIAAIVLVQSGPVGRWLLVAILVVSLAALVAIGLRIVTHADHAEIDVSAEPEEVFNLLIDPHDLRMADPRMVDLRLVSGEAGSTGSTYEYALAVGRRRLEVHCEVLEAAIPSTLTMRHYSPPMVATDTYSITPSQGGCHVELDRLFEMTPLAYWSTRKERAAIGSQMQRLASVVAPPRA